MKIKYTPTPNSIALWICAVTGLAWACIIILKYYNFEYSGWDLGLYAHLMWSLCHGSATTSLFNGNFLIDHANYIAFLLTPIYFLFQSPLTLLLLKIAAFFSGAYIFFLITSKKLGSRWALIFMTGYIFYPANIAMLFFEFNFENLAIPLIFLAFYFFEEKRFRPFILTCALLCTVKENMPPVVIMFGLYALWNYRKDTRELLRWSMTALLMGAAVFLAWLLIIYPWLARNEISQTSPYWWLYKPVFGTSVTSILHTIFFSPLKIFNALFNDENMLFIGELFGPLIIPAILNPITLLLGLPLFLQNLLSHMPGQHSIFYYYASTLTVFIFLASIDPLSRVREKYRRYALTLTCLAILIFDLCYLQTWALRLPQQNDSMNTVRAQLLSRIPPRCRRRGQ